MRLLQALATLALIAPIGDVATAGPPARQPNILFIMADDLGYGDLSCYGQSRFKTPRIDGLAKQGMRFTDFYAGSTVCAPSRCVLMTGKHTGHCYIRGNAKENLPPEEVTVAEVLKKAGYTTGLFGKWGLGHEGSVGVPTRQGFDEFFGYLDQHHAHNYYPAYLHRGEERVNLKNVVPGGGEFGSGVATTKVEYSADLILDEALSFIDQHHAEPFFLYFASTLPHANNQGGPKGMEVPSLGEYANTDWPEPQQGLAAMIGRLDDAVGSLADKLDEHGLTGDTIVFFTSDNGPHNEGGNRAEFFDSNGPLKGTKRSLHDGGIRVPMIVRWPGHVEAGSESGHVGYFGDFLPTAAELAGVKPPAGLDGLSLLPVLTGVPDPPSHGFLYWEFYEGSGGRAVRMRDWKAVVEPWGGQVKLYDLSHDLGETRNLAAEYPAVAAEAAAIMQREHVPSPLWTPPTGKGKR